MTNDGPTPGLVDKPERGIIAERGIIGMMGDRERLGEALGELIATVRDVAVTSLAYCEGKYGHDDQARCNVEAALEAAMVVAARHDVFVPSAEPYEF